MALAHRRRSLQLLALALLAALAVLAASVLRPGPSADAAAAGTTVKIDIKDYAYSKPKVTIHIGDKVKWTNRDDMRHNATTSQKGGPDGPLLDQGKSYTWTAKKTGTFKYHCDPHPFMKGTVIVKK